MQFYRMTLPKFETDLDEARANPFREVRTLGWLPFLQCSVCGEVGTGTKLRCDPPPTNELLELLKYRTIRPNEWMETAEYYGSVLNVSADKLNPGMEIGPPRGEMWRDNATHIRHAGLRWANSEVVDALDKLGATGVQFHRVKLHWAFPWDDFFSPVGLEFSEAKRREPSESTPELWELTVVGQAWRRGMTLAKITKCTICGRFWFPDPNYLDVDEGRWDGSDFFSVDRNPNIVLVSERIRDLFLARGFLNCRFVPSSREGFP